MNNSGFMQQVFQIASDFGAWTYKDRVAWICRGVTRVTIMCLNAPLDSDDGVYFSATLSFRGRVLETEQIGRSRPFLYDTCKALFDFAKTKDIESHENKKTEALQEFSKNFPPVYSNE